MTQEDNDFKKFSDIMNKELIDISHKVTIIKGRTETRMFWKSGWKVSRPTGFINFESLMKDVISKFQEILIKP